jgi:hypothetical protein
VAARRKKIVMIVQFWPCPGCSRHVKRGDALCPFCGATASIEISPRPTIAGRLSRAALFAAGAVGTALATANCGAPYGLPPGGFQVETEDSGASDGPSETDAEDTSTTPDSASTADAPSTADGPNDAGDASTSTVPTDSSSASDVLISTPPYGQGPIPDE